MNAKEKKSIPALCFDTPISVAVDRAGNVYVADIHEKIFKISPAGEMSLFADMYSRHSIDLGEVVCGTGAAIGNVIMLPLAILGSMGPHGSRDSSPWISCPSKSEYSNLSLASDLTGNLYVANPGKSTIHKITAEGEVSTLAGWKDSPGRADGKGVFARFGYPSGVTTDKDGNVYVTDYLTLRKITPDGKVSTLAGSFGVEGNQDGSGAKASFQLLGNASTDSAGNIYAVQYAGAIRNIRKITPAGVVSTLAGDSGGAYGAKLKDGPGLAARFNMPEGLATDRLGNLYVADKYNGAIRKITPAGMVSTLAVYGENKDGMIGNPVRADLYDVYAVAVDSVSNLYALSRGTILKISTDGTVSKFNTRDIGGGDPHALAIDPYDNVYVTDKQNHSVIKITSTGVMSLFAGGGEIGNIDGTGSAARFSGPNGIATDKAGNVYVADGSSSYYKKSNDTIRKITPAGMVTTFAGKAGEHGVRDGMGAAATFTKPESIAVDSSGNVYVSDGTHDIQIKPTAIRKITPAGMVSTLVGVSIPMRGTSIAAHDTTLYYVQDSGIVVLTNLARDVEKEKLQTGKVGVTAALPELSLLAGNLNDQIRNSSTYTDGMGTAATFFGYRNITTDVKGNVYVSNQYGNSPIRKITPSGLVSSLPVSPLPGERLVAGPHMDGARYGSQNGIVTDKQGNIFLLNSGSIRKITPARMESIVAGEIDKFGSKDGIAKEARLSDTSGLAIDSEGNLYVTEAHYERTPKVRKITPGGVVSTLAEGTAKSSANGGIAVDGAGNVYVSDMLKYIVLKITPGGVVTTLAGKAGEKGYKDGKGEEARFARPEGLATDSAGNVYVADSQNYIVRKITPVGEVSTVVGTPGQGRFDAGPLPGRLLSPMAVAVNGTTLYITMERGIAVVRNLP